MITRLVFAMAFVLGAVAIGMMGANFYQSHGLALAVTAVIGGVYAIGAIELLQFRRATRSLTRALAALSEQAAAGLKALDEWLIRLHPSLHHAVRQRVEGDGITLPSPVLTPYLVSLLVMLGLLGTFVGLVETLKGVVVALEGSSDLESIRQALTAPMGGLGLAFGTSVAGVAASAMLGLMSTLSRRSRMLATRELDGKIGTDLRPFSRAHQQQETFQALQVQSRSLPAIADKLEALAGQISRMTDRVGEQLATNQEQFHESVKTMYGELAASVEQSLQQSVDKGDRVLAETGRLVGEGIRPIMREAMESISAEINQGAQTTHRQLSRTVEEQLQALSGQFGQTSEAVARAWQDGLTAHERSNQELVRDMQATFGAFNERFDQASLEVLAEIRQTSVDWSDRQAANDEARLDRWTGALQQTQHQATTQFEQASTAIIGELRAAAESQQTGIQSLTGELTRLSSEVTAQLQRSGEQAIGRQQQLIAALEATARSIGEDAQTRSTRMLSEIGRLLSASEALIQTRIETESGWLEGHDQRLGQLTAAVGRELAALREQEAQRGQAAVERLTELESTVTAHLSSLGQALEAPMTRLIETASETPRAAAEVIGQLRREISNNMERDNQLLEERSRLMAELDRLSESQAQSSAGQVAAIERLVDSSANLLQEVSEQFSRQVTGEVSKVAEVADHFAAGAAEISSLGEAFKLAVELYNASNGQLIEGLRHIEHALEQSTTRSDEQLGYYVAQAREVIDYSALTQKEIFDELRQLKLADGEVRTAAKVN